MNQPFVSIIIPIYNVEQYLDRCMDSILNQSLDNIEIILVDDESPDNCPIKCEEYASKDSRIKVIHKKNEGLGFARNSGLEIASGEYVAFVDSDDYVDLKMYEKLYATAQEYSLDTVYCGFNNIDTDLKIWPISEVSNPQIFDSPESIKNVLLNMIANEPSAISERTYRMSVWHGIYSRELIINNKIRFCSEREFISEDIFFHIDYLTRASKIAFIPDQFYNYCFNRNSLTKSFRKDRFKKHKILYNGLLEKFHSLNYLNSFFKQRVDRFFIGYVRSDIITISKAKITFSEKRKMIKEICYDSIWQSLSDYPYNRMPLKHQFVSFLIKYKMINLLIIILNRR